MSTFRRTVQIVSTQTLPAHTAPISAPMPSCPEPIDDGVEMAAWTHPSTGAVRVYINGVAGKATKVYAEPSTHADRAIVVRVYDDSKTGGERANVAARAYLAIEARIGKQGRWTDLMQHLQDAGRMRVLRKAGIL